MKYTFTVSDMNCGNCKKHIEEGLQNWGKADSWSIDLDTKTVIVESAESETSVRQVIEDEGYSPVLQ
jgi:copper chaperone CopZ